MKTTWRVALATALGTFCLATGASAGELKLTIADGHVTLMAKDVTVREILAEWARVGQARIVNAEKLTGGPVTLELTNVPEAGALDAILRSAAGYVLAPRTAGAPGASVYDRIMILASSRAPAAASPSASPFTSRPMPQAPLQTAPDEEQDYVQPGVMPNANIPGQPNVAPGQPNFLPGQPPVNPAMIQQQMPTGQPQAPMTAPRPGMLPAPVNPTQPPVNPYLGQPPGPTSPTFNPMPQQPNLPNRPGAPGTPGGPGGPGGQ